MVESFRGQIEYNGYPFDYSGRVYYTESSGDYDTPPSVDVTQVEVEEVTFGNTDDDALAFFKDMYLIKQVTTASGETKEIRINVAQEIKSIVAETLRNQ
jgi:hypothetical protein